MRRHLKHVAPARRGYALLVTLVMLALLGVILGGLARRSADAALQARDAEQAMRHRWAELSCGHTLLATAPKRSDAQLNHWQASLEDSDYLSQVAPPTRQEVFTLKLAGLDIRGRIDDEQAKVNLNERLRSSPDAAIMPSAVVDEVLSPSRSAGIRLTRQPFIEALGLQPLMSWPQVFPGYSPPELLGLDRPEALTDSLHSQAAANRVTLWGDGSLKFWTASDEVIRKRLQDTAQPSTVEALLRLRSEGPTLPLGTLFENATEDRDERARLQSVFVERSRCHSMWIAIRPADQDHVPAKWSFWVAEQGEGQEPGRLRAFRW